MERQELQGACKQLRLRLGLSQSDLGEQMGVAGNSIYRWEQGGLPPSGDSLAKYVNLAAKHGHHDLAAIFRSALGAEISDDLVKALNYTGQASNSAEPPRVRVVNAVMLQVPRRLGPVMQAVLDMLENPKDEVESSFADHLMRVMERKLAQRESVVPGKEA